MVVAPVGFPQQGSLTCPQCTHAPREQAKPGAQSPFATHRVGQLPFLQRKLAPQGTSSWLVVRQAPPQSKVPLWQGLFITQLPPMRGLHGITQVCVRASQESGLLHAPLQQG